MHVCSKLASDGFAGNFGSAADAVLRRLSATAKDGNRRREQGGSNEEQGLSNAASAKRS
jgi:hypothetical protein